MREKQIKRFDGYLFSKLAAIGSRSEGPSYRLQRWNYKETHVIKQVHPWKEDPNLHKFLGKKVTITGTSSENGIDYVKIQIFKIKPS